MPNTRSPRSRSPYHRDRSHRAQARHRQRSGSPRGEKHHHHSVHDRKAEKPRQYEKEIILPLRARQISKHDLRHYKPMFALYLDIQKSLDIEDLTDDEVKGRWKSFMGKWNRGELAEGWYDPETLRKALQEEHKTRTGNDKNITHNEEGKGTKLGSSGSITRDIDDRIDDKEDDDFGPSLPITKPNTTVSTYLDAQWQGPVPPNIYNLRDRDEQTRENAEAARNEHLASLRAERKADRQLQKERLDDLTPRADAGSRQRMLENKRLIAQSNRSFAAAAGAGGDIELKDSEVMGDEDSMADLKRMKRENERKKNEREIRREEILRARMAEREERAKGLRAKENKTMEMLKKIAQARFGNGGDPEDNVSEQG